MPSLLAGAQLLPLFVVIALGYLLGTLRLAGFSLGVAAVLFAGLLLGWLAPAAVLPEFVAQLGLVLFVYTIGLASGPGFFASLRLRGLRDNALVVAVLFGSFAVALGLAKLLGVGGAVLAGMFAGALNNAPALAAATETLRIEGASAAATAQAVLAFSLCYPLGVLVPLLAIAGGERCFGVRYAQEHVSRSYAPAGAGPLVSTTVRIDYPVQESAHDLKHLPDCAVAFGRVKRGDLTSVVQGSTLFQVGDLVTVIGTASNVEAMTRLLGQAVPEHIELDRSAINFRRISVSNSKVTERPLRELALPQRYGAVITRVRRGDVDFTPHADFELLLGDRARVVAPVDRLPELTELFGDSARRSAEVDLITFGLGVALGLVLGAVSIPLPGGARFALGAAGGPLVVGLILGRLGRTGPLVWTLPYSANLTLRQLGLVLFMAGVGLKAGASIAAQSAPGGLLVLLAGLGVTSFVVLTCLVLGRQLLRIPLSVLAGMLAGIQTQPAVLAFALEKTEQELPNVGYASVFPLAMVAKIVLAQLALQLLAWR